MAKLKVKKGDFIDIEVSLEFEGTVHNSLVLVESQTIQTNGSATKRAGTDKVKTDGDPIQWIMFFNGEIGSVIKKHQLTINEITYRGIEDIKLKSTQIRIEIPVPFWFFDLEEVFEDEEQDSSDDEQKGENSTDETIEV